jgi:signal transduction histidine kinase
VKSVREVFWPGKGSVLLISIAGFIGVVLAVSTSVNTWQLSIITASLTTIYTAAVLMALVSLRHLIEKNAKLSIPLMLGALIALGASRGWVFYEIGVVLDLKQRAGIETRIINSTLTIFIWGLIFISIESRLQWFRKNFQESVTFQTLQLAKRSDFTKSEIANSIDSMSNIQELQANLRAIAESAKASNLNSTQLITAAVKIREEIEISLRPLSQRIWFDSVGGFPKFRIWELLKESLRGLRINWWLTALASGSTFYIGALSVLDSSDAGVRSIAFVACFAFLLFILSKYRGLIIGSAKKGLLILVFIAVISNLFGDFFTFSLLGVTAFSGNVLLPLFGPLTSFGVLWIAALLGQLKIDWAYLDQVLAKDISQPQAELLQSRIAGFLHNSVQSELSGIALALERVSPENLTEIRNLLNRLESVATRSLGSEFTNSNLVPKARLVKVVESWQGIVEVNCEYSEIVFENPNMPLAVELIEEAVSNAVRHSQAKEVWINIQELGESLKVTITHPPGTQNKGKSRLGTLWMDRYSKHYKISFTPNGQRELTVVI